MRCRLRVGHALCERVHWSRPTASPSTSSPRPPPQPRPPTGTSGRWAGAPRDGSELRLVPDLAASRPTGDFTLYADVTMIDWTPGVQQYIALHGNEGTSAGCNWLLYVHRRHAEAVPPDGLHCPHVHVECRHGLTDGTRKKIKVTWDQDNGSTQSEAKVLPVRRRVLMDPARDRGHERQHGRWERRHGGPALRVQRHGVTDVWWNDPTRRSSTAT